MTNEGSIIGTPHYMSPEQASGRVSKIDARSDLFSMGIIFYELLTGDVPFAGQSMVVIRAISETQAPSVELAKPSLPRELVRVVDKCLSLDQSRRYQTAKQLADDLLAWQQGVSVRTNRLFGMSRSAAWMMSASVLCLGMLGIATVYSRHKSSEFPTVHLSPNELNQNELHSLLAGWVNDGDPDQLTNWLAFDAPDSSTNLEQIELASHWRLDLAKGYFEPSSIGTKLVNPDAFYENIAEHSDKNWEVIFAKCDRELLSHLARKASLDRRAKVRHTLIDIFARHFFDRNESALLCDLLMSVRPVDLSSVLNNMGSGSKELSSEVERRFAKWKETLDSSSLFSEDSDIKNCSRLGLAAYKLGKWEVVDRVIGFAVDPRVRTAFITEFRESSLDIDPFLQRFPVYHDDWIGAAIIECYLDQNSVAEPKHTDGQFIQFLKDVFQTHPSAGVHWMVMGALKSHGQHEWIDEVVAKHQEWQTFSESRNWFHLHNNIPMSVLRAPMTYHFGLDREQLNSVTSRHELVETIAISAIPLTHNHLASLSEHKGYSPDNKLSLALAQKYCDELNKHTENPEHVFTIISAWQWECAMRAGTRAMTWDDLSDYQDMDFGNLNPIGFGSGSDEFNGELCSTDIQSIQPQFRESDVELIVYKGGTEPREKLRRNLARNGFVNPFEEDRFRTRLVLKPK